MTLPSFIENKLMQLADAMIERRLQPVPSLDRLNRCQIVSHRGDHGHNPLNENTMAAFRRAAMGGVWGVELDIRFTADLEPVVFHDPTLERIFGVQQPVAQLSCRELKNRFPAIPTLDEVVKTFGHTLHLMIEVKAQPWPDPPRQNKRLQEILSGLTPCEEFHLICLHPQALQPLEGFAPRVRVVISEYGPELRSRWLLRRRWGGLCGHYLLLRRGIIRALHRNGQQAGTGYIRSCNGLFREINRGVDWIFSNHAVQLQGMVNACLSPNAPKKDRDLGIY
jgi:glycerophosphoryl diester phosphodiesterase